MFFHKKNKKNLGVKRKFENLSTSSLNVAHAADGLGRHDEEEESEGEEVHINANPTLAAWEAMGFGSNACESSISLLS